MCGNTVDKTWYTGEGNGKPLQYSCLENPMNSIKRQKGHWKMNSPDWQVPKCYWRSVEKELHKNEEAELKQKQHPVVDVTGDGSKVRCCKEQYCIGTWNVRSINQGKLEVVKQEMVRVIINTLGISKLKWTGMGESNSDDHYIYYCGQESLRRYGVALMVKKEFKMQYLRAISKMTE